MQLLNFKTSSTNMKTRPPPKAAHLKSTLRLVDRQVATILSTCQCFSSVNNKKNGNWQVLRRY